MRGDSSSRNRHSVRLPAHDYAAPGSYFITICTHGRECLFGEIDNGRVVLNAFGEIVRQEWQRSAEIRRELGLDAFVVMPNHLHGIVHIMDISSVVGAHGHAPLPDPFRRPPRSIGSFVARFKGAAIRRINAKRDAEGTPVWQRNCYEHIVRDEADLERIRQYIADNPHHWTADEYHPGGTSS
jgi:putative transposase